MNMNAHWTFEGGHLVARNPAGAALWAWQADEAMGRPLADLLNQAQDLSRRLLTSLQPEMRDSIRSG